MSLYWIEQTVAVLPLVLWVYLGLGIPYALLALPREDWQRRIDVIALSFAFGPALLTAWMFILGTIGGAQEQATLRFDWIFAGTIVLALIGYGLLWRKWQSSTSSKRDSLPLAFDEKLLITLIIIAVAVRWLVISYWSFTAYDALWVYGYEGRLYQVLGYIPETIGYYPQFLPLQYTFLQLLSDGFNDHAARAVIPFLHIGSILATYVMGSRLISRRTGIIASAIWTLYPHVALWAHVGDLEIPLTFLLTLTMTFFVLAWIQTDTALRRRYALISGLCFGIAMWTKPTGGAFVLGVILLVVSAFIVAQFNWKRWYPRFEITLITGLACIPLGAIWYIRNVALGLDALVFPHESWLTLATRSGDLLSFPLLALLLAISYLASTRKLQHGWIVLIGVVLILAGAMPSSPLIDEARRNSPQSYITWIEATMLMSGVLLVAWGLRHHWLFSDHPTLKTVGWSILLILPYFITWFWSYSYHARLSFPIVPFMILPTAVILAHCLPTQKMSNWRILPKIGWSGLLILLSIPAIILPITGIAGYSDYLWVNRYPNDFERTKSQNPGVSLVAEYLWGYADFTGELPIVIAPGEQRLRFFMPDVTIISDTVPTRYEDLDDATHFLYGTQARWRYEDENIISLENRIVASLGRDNLFNQVLDFETGTFEYELYELSLDARFSMPERGPSGHLIEDTVIFGEAIRYAGDSINNTQLVGNRVGIAFLWDVIAPPEGNYLVQLDLLNTEDDTVYATWQTPVAPSEDAYYNTALWQVSEFVVDERFIEFTDPDVPRASNIYRMIVNFVDAETGERIPMTINGEPAEGYPMQAPFSVGN